MKVAPMYMNEENKCYFRGGACIQELTTSEIQDLAQDKVVTHYEELLEIMKKDRMQLLTELAELSNVSVSQLQSTSQPTCHLTPSVGTN